MGREIGGRGVVMFIGLATELAKFILLAGIDGCIALDGPSRA